MLPKKQDYFALSFSDYQIHFVQATRKGRLQKHVAQKLNPGIIERGEIKNREALRQALEQLLQAVKPKDKFVVIGLPEVRAFTRSFNLPSLSIEELDDAARFESEPVLPFPLENAYLDWMILERTKEEVRVLVIALPQDLVEDYAKLLEEMNFQPVAFEITSLSLARLVDKDKAATLIVGVKEKEAVLVIVGAQGGIEVSSTISFKDEREAATEIVSTVKNLLDFYRKKVGEKEEAKKITKILFCGQDAKEILVKKTEQETKIPSSILKTKRPDLASFISLASKDVAAPIDEKTINLIPPRIQGIYDRAAKVSEISGWLKLGLFCLFLIFFGYAVSAARIYFEIKKIEGQVIELQAAITPKTKELGERAQALNSRAETVVSLGDSYSEIASLFPLIREKVPEGISVTHYSFDGDRDVIFVSGVASRREDLLTFREVLEETEKFDRVHIPLSSLEKEVDVQFTISITNKEGA